MTSIETGMTVEEMTPEQGRALFDRTARDNLGISGDEFLAKWDAGEYDDDPDRPEVLRVAMLMPFGRA